MPIRFHMFQRRFKIIHQGIERSAGRGRPRDQNIIPTPFCMGRHYKFDGFAEPSSGPVAHHRTADLAAGGEPDTTGAITRPGNRIS